MPSSPSSTWRHRLPKRAGRRGRRESRSPSTWAKPGLTMTWYGGICSSTFLVEMSEDGQVWSEAHYAQFGQENVLLALVPAQREDDEGEYCPVSNGFPARPLRPPHRGARVVPWRWLPGRAPGPAHRPGVQQRRERAQKGIPRPWWTNRKRSAPPYFCRTACTSTRSITAAPPMKC